MSCQNASEPNWSPSCVPDTSSQAKDTRNPPGISPELSCCSLFHPRRRGVTLEFLSVISLYAVSSGGSPSCKYLSSTHSWIVSFPSIKVRDLHVNADVGDLGVVVRFWAAILDAGKGDGSTVHLHLRRMFIHLLKDCPSRMGLGDQMRLCVTGAEAIIES